jgi:WD40 repeat protein
MTYSTFKKCMIIITLFLIHDHTIKCCEKKINKEGTDLKHTQMPKDTSKTPVSSMTSIMHCPQLRRIPPLAWRNYVAPASGSIDPILPLTISPHQTLAHSADVESANFNNDGSKVVTVANDMVHMWTQGQAKPVIIKLDKNQKARSARFNKAGDLLLIGHSKGLGLYDCSGKCLQQNLNIRNVNDPHFNQDESHIVFAGNIKVVSIWNPKNGRQSICNGHDSLVSSVSFNPDGTQVISSSMNMQTRDGSIRIWKAENGEPMHVIQVPQAVCRAQFSPDGKRIMASLLGAHSGIWDANTGLQTDTIPEELSCCSDFNHDGSQMIHGLFSGSVHMRDAHTMQPLMHLEGHTNTLRSVQFNHNGTQVLSASEDKTAKLWNIPPIQALYRTTPHQSHLIDLLTRCRSIIESDPKNPDKRRSVVAFYLSSIPKAKKMNQQQTADFMDEARTTLHSFDPLVKATIIKKFKIRDGEKEAAAPKQSMSTLQKLESLLKSKSKS